MKYFKPTGIQKKKEKKKKNERNPLEIVETAKKILPQSHCFYIELPPLGMNWQTTAKEQCAAHG